MDFSCLEGEMIMLLLLNIFMIGFIRLLFHPFCVHSFDNCYLWIELWRLMTMVILCLYGALAWALNGYLSLRRGFYSCVDCMSCWVEVLRITIQKWRCSRSLEGLLQSVHSSGTNWSCQDQPLLLQCSSGTHWYHLDWEWSNIKYISFFLIPF